VDEVYNEIMEETEEQMGMTAKYANYGKENRPEGEE
jgi:hypothetical protein